MQSLCTEGKLGKLGKGMREYPLVKVIEAKRKDAKENVFVDENIHELKETKTVSFRE